MRFILRLVTISLLLVGIATPVLAQKKDSNSLLKEANKLFEDGKYAEAYPLFTQLLSIRKGDPDITYKYGATLLYGSEKKADAISYLKKSSKQSSIDVRVFYFLGKAYHLNYEFDKAIKAYSSFKSKADSKLLDQFNVDLSIDQCNNGKELLSQIKDVLVIDRKDVDSKEFFRYYELDNLAGKILIAPEDLQSSLDKKKGHVPIIYSTPLSNIVYFSSYGKSGDRGTDIYYVSRRGDGSWTDPILLPETINTKYNEDYPFMHPDGKTLYFCSEGHTSMGGFDVFRAIVDHNNGIYSVPENLDFAINTPDDDLLYIADSLNQNAFFASSRASKQDHLSVYEVKVSLVPSSIILIKGKFSSELDPSLKNARITVEDAQTQRQIGVYSTEADGSYLLDFTYGGSYIFYVESGKSGIIHTGKVEIPRLESIAAFGQELVMIDNEGKEMLMIKNYFGEELDEDVQELLAMALRKRADLEITPENIIDEKLKEQEAIEADASFDDLYIAAGLTTFHSNDDVANWSSKMAIELEENNDDYKALSSKAYAEYNSFQEEANQLISESQAMYDQFENSDDPAEKHKLLKASITLRNEAKVKLLNSSSAMMLSKRLNESIKEREKLISDLHDAEVVLREGIEQNNSSVVESSLSEVKALKAKSKESVSGKSSAVSYLSEVKEIEKKKADQAYNSAEDLRNEKADQVKLLMRLQTQQNNAKKSEKEELATQIDETQVIIDRIENDLPEKWVNYRALDWNNKVAEIGLDYATNWEYDQNSGPLPVEDQIIASGNSISTAKESISSMESLENEALVSLGISYEELMSKEVPSDIVKNDESAATGEVMGVKSQDEESISEVTIENSFVSDYDSKIITIENNPVVLDRLEATILLKAEVLREVNRNLESNTSNYSDEELSTAKTQLEEETILLFEEFKQSIENLQETNMDVNDFIPDYEQQVEEIENISSTDLERKSNRIDHYNSSIDYLELILDSLNTIPVEQNDPFLMRQQIEKLNALKIIITELNIERYEVQQNVELLSKLAEVPGEYEMVSSLDANYHQKWESIDNSEQSIDDKAARRIQLNESLIAKINGEIASVNNEISNSEAKENPVLNKRIEILEEIKLEKENEINASVMAMAIGIEPDTSPEVSGEETIPELESEPSIESEDLIAEVMPDFNKELTAIELSDMPDEVKLRKKQALYLDLSKAVDGRVNEFNDDNITEGNEYNSWIALQNEVKKETIAINDGLPTALIDDAEKKEEVELVENEKSIEQEAQNVVSAFNYAATENAMIIFNNEGKIVKDPGFTSLNLKSEASKYQAEIQEVNNLHDQLIGLKIKERNATDKEKKKIRKEIEKVQKELTSKETELLTNWIPLIHVENEDNPSDEIYLELSKQVFADASTKKGEEKLEALKEAYVLSLLAMQSNQVQYIESNPSSLVPLSKRNNQGFSYDNLLIDEKRLVLEMNIEKLQVNILEAETKAAELRSTGMQESEEELKGWVEISKTYQEALVWNQTKLKNLNSLESNIDGQADKQVSMIKAPTGKEAFGRSLSKIGLDESQTDLITSDPEIQTYFAMKYIENEVADEINKLRKMRSAYRDKADQSFEAYNTAGATNATTSSEAISNYNENESTYKEALLWYSKTDSIHLLISALEKKKIELNNNLETYYDNLESINKQTISDINEGKTPVLIQETVVISEANKEDVNTDDATKELVEEIIIDDTNENVVVEELPVEEIKRDVREENSSDGFMYEAGIVFYSDQEPIPVNPPLPQGLIFKVQIGAYRNPLPMEHFIGLSPMMAEELSNGITRYSVGIFNEIEDARNARSQVRNLGYNDAFIVAFLNGERIPINRALEMLGEDQGDIADNSIRSNPDGNTESGVRNADRIPESDTNTNNSERAVDRSSTNYAPATSVKTIDHLFFCVQVGVYSKKIRVEDVFGISPLNIELTSSGFYRYTSGQFSSLSDAGRHKNEVIAKGIPDAFVTAYYQGQRISVGRASALIEQDPSILEAGSVTPVQELPKVKEEPTIVPPVSTPTEEVEDLPPASDLRFVIFIGSYADNIPNNVASALLDYSYVGIKKAVNAGNTIYSTKELKSFNEATIILQSFQERGLEQVKMLYVLYDKEVTEKNAFKILDQ